MRASYRVSLTKTRRVWAAVTAHPRASCKDLCRLSGIRSTSTVQYALNRLHDAGYIERLPGRARTLRVIVPFVRQYG